MQRAPDDREGGAGCIARLAPHLRQRFRDGVPRPRRDRGDGKPRDVGIVGVGARAQPIVRLRDGAVAADAHDRGVEGEVEARDQRARLARLARGDDLDAVAVRRGRGGGRALAAAVARGGGGGGDRARGGEAREDGRDVALVRADAVAAPRGGVEEDQELLAGAPGAVPERRGGHALGEDAIARGDERHDRVEAEDVIDAVRAGAATAAEHAAPGRERVDRQRERVRAGAAGDTRDVAGVDPNVRTQGDPRARHGDATEEGARRAMCRS